jgi:C-terminal processing protease CtpA/Prc
VACSEYQQFRVSADGELQGIGLLIANELSASGHLTVLAPIKGGPADRAGILPGDEVRGRWHIVQADTGSGWRTINDT